MIPSVILCGDIVFDTAKVPDHQLYNSEQTQALESDWAPILEPWHGVGIYADAFGSETSWPEDAYPWTEPFIERIDDVYDLIPAPPVEDMVQRKEMVAWTRDKIADFCR